MERTRGGEILKSVFRGILWAGVIGLVVFFGCVLGLWLKNKRVHAQTSTGLQATINAACSGGTGGYVYIGQGQFPLYASVVLTAANSNCTIAGAGLSQTVLKLSANMAPWGDGTNGTSGKPDGIVISGATNIQLMDFTLDGNGANEPNGRGIYLVNGATKFRGFRVRTQNTAEHGWMLDDGATNFRCYGCEADTEINGSGFEIGNTPLNAVVNDVQLIGGRADNSQVANGVFTIGSKSAGQYGNNGIQVIGMTFTGNADTAIEAGASSQNVVIAGNKIALTLGTGQTGIMARSSGPDQIVGNAIECNGSANQKAIFVTSNGGGDNTTTRQVNIEGNTVRGCTGTGSRGIELNSGDDIQVNNNHLDTSSFFVNSTVTNYRTGGGANWTWSTTASKPMLIDSAVASAGNALAFLQFQATQGGAAGFRIRENQTALPNGLWRVHSSSDALCFNKNTAVAGDFSTNFDAACFGTGSTGTFTVGQGAISTVKYNTQSNCTSSSGTCASAPEGAVTIAAAATTVTVATTQVTANSNIRVQEDSSLGSRLGVTCNTTTGRLYTVTARTAGTSFVITASAAPVTNPACLVYSLSN